MLVVAVVEVKRNPNDAGHVGILQWPEEQSRSGCGQDGGDADQSQHVALLMSTPPRAPSAVRRRHLAEFNN